MIEETAELSSVLKRGAAMAAIGLFVGQSAVIVQTIVVGRLLGPIEVGVFTAGTVIMGLIVEATQGALSGALIHRRTDLDAAAATALVATVGTGLLLGLTALAASPLIAAIFHSHRIGLMAAATSGVALLHSLSAVPDALMQRAFQFKRQMIVTPAASLTFASVSMVLAGCGYGAWALVIGWYASTALTVVLSWSLARWRPVWRGVSFRLWRELSAFSWPMLLDGISERTRQLFEQVVVGRVLGTGTLGQFRYGYRIAMLPSMAVVTVCAHVLFPAFARISDDPARFRTAYLRALGWTCFAAIPVGALTTALGEPTVVLLLGDQWRPAGVAVAAMAGIGVGAALNSVAGEAMKGAGRSALLNWPTGLSLVIGVPLILVALPFGLTGVGVALSVSYLAMGVVTTELARGVIGLNRRDTYRRVVPIALSALSGLAVVLPLEHFVVNASHRPPLPGIGLLIAQVLLFVLVFAGVLRVLAPYWLRGVQGLTHRSIGRLVGVVRRTETP